MGGKNGWIVTNGSQKVPAFLEMAKTYIKAAKRQDVSLEHVYNNDLMVSIVNGKTQVSGKEKMPDFILFLDKDIRLAGQLEALGIPLFNSSHVIEVCDDKAKTCQYLADKGIPMPQTVIAPLMFYGVEEEEAYILKLETLLGYPMVVKECFGSFGEQVYLVHDRAALKEKRHALMTVPHIYQQYIGTSKGRDVRVYIVGDQVVGTMLRTNETDFRANVTSGGHGIRYVADQAFESLALDVGKILKADFLGVDLLFGENEEPILCEVNSNAHIKAISACTGVDIAGEIISHIVKTLDSKKKVKR